MSFFVIPGPPVGKARPRVTRRGTHYPPKYAAWLQYASSILRYEWSRPPLDGRLWLQVSDYAARPKRRPAGVPPDEWSSHRALPRPTKPDGDNVIGAVADALENAGVIVNDSRIVRWVCEDWWVALDTEPRVELSVGLWILG